MSNRTCIWADCDRQWIAQKYCPVHYRRARKDGLIETLDRSDQHQITEHDQSTETGVCSICGPVKVKLLIGKGRDRTAACHNALRARQRVQRSRQITTEKYKAYHREYRRRSKFNLPPGGIKALIEAADYRCQICATEVTLAAPIDHDHSCCDSVKTCGKCIRGVLCTPCNAGLGFFADDPVRLESAIRYLAAYAAERVA